MSTKDCGTRSLKIWIITSGEAAVGHSWGEIGPWSPRLHSFQKEDRALGGTMCQPGMWGAPVCVMAKLKVDLWLLRGGGGLQLARCGPATQLQPLLPHDLHCQLSSMNVRVSRTLSCSSFLSLLPEWGKSRAASTGFRALSPLD